MTIDAIATIREETERSVAALASTAPDQQVPTCPDWTADDLLWHLAEVHEFWAAILEAGATTRSRSWRSRKAGPSGPSSARRCSPPQRRDRALLAQQPPRR